jgi:hypothetical protein
MKRLFVFLLLIPALVSGEDGGERSVIPLNVARDVSLVTVRVGRIVIPDILIDTGFAFDGLMIYNPNYEDSLDLTGALKVRIGGAGSGEASTALMVDSASFYLGDVEMRKQRLLVLQGDIYKGFPSNGLIGYSIFGHYVTEFNNDDHTMVLHDADETGIGEGWTKIPLYFKDNKIPWMDASVVIEDEDPIRLSTYIDFAARDAVVLLEKPDMKFSLPGDMADVHLGRGLSGDVYGKTGRIAKLIIGPYELKNVKASFAPAEVRSKQPGADAVIGSASLIRFNLIFDYSNKALYVKPNARFTDPFD